MHFSADFGALAAAGDGCFGCRGGVHRARRSQQRRQPRGGHVGSVLQTGAAACVAGAGQQGLLETFGPAQCIAAFKQPHQCAGTQCATAVNVGVLARHHFGQFAAIGGHTQALGQPGGQFRAAPFVADVARPGFRVGRALAQVVAQAGPAHGQRRMHTCGFVQHQQQVHAGVHLGVVGRRLRHAPQAIHLGQQARQRAAFAQHFQHAAGARRHQPA